MERLTKQRNKGINGNALRTWALLFVAAGVIGRGVIQTHMLGVGQVSAQQLLELMSTSSNAMTLVTCSLVLQALETCAVPIYALMLVEGFQHTSDAKAYFLRVFALALISEIPYNLAIGGRLFAPESRNPVFSLVICMLMLFIWKSYSAGGVKNTIIKIAISAAAILWCQMLKIEFGAAVVLVTAVMWSLRGNALYRNFAGAAAAIVCTLISPFFMASPMGFMAVHFYDGEKCTTTRKLNYLAYPVLLAAAAAVGMVF